MLSPLLWQYPAQETVVRKLILPVLNTPRFWEKE